jgi:hypothetical protein
VGLGPGSPLESDGAVLRLAAIVPHGRLRRRHTKWRDGARILFLPLGGWSPIVATRGVCCFYPSSMPAPPLVLAVACGSAIPLASCLRSFLKRCA